MDGFKKVLELVISPITAIIETIVQNVKLIVGWLNPLGDEFILKDPIGFILDIVQLLNPFSDKFMLAPIVKQFTDFTSNLFSYFNPLHDNFILKTVIENFKYIISLFTPTHENFIFNNLFKWLNPLHEDFILRVAFVPGDGYFSEKFGKIQEVIFEKFPFIEQLASVINPNTLQISMYADDIDPDLGGVLNPPISNNGLNITMPSKYGGGTYTWMDFSYFMEYRSTIFAVIRVCIWFPFLKWLYGRIPSLLNGGMGMDYRNANTVEKFDSETGEGRLHRRRGA